MLINKKGAPIGTPCVSVNLLFIGCKCTSLLQNRNVNLCMLAFPTSCWISCGYIFLIFIIINGALNESKYKFSAAECKCLYFLAVKHYRVCVYHLKRLPAAQAL